MQWQMLDGPLQSQGSPTAQAQDSSLPCIARSASWVYAHHIPQPIKVGLLRQSLLWASPADCTALHNGPTRRIEALIGWVP